MVSALHAGSRGQKRWNFIDRHEVFAKTQKVLFDVFRSILSNYEATSTAKLIAAHVLVTKGFVSTEYQAHSSQLSRDLEIYDSDILRNTLHLGCCQWWRSGCARSVFSPLSLVLDERFRISVCICKFGESLDSK